MTLKHAPTPGGTSVRIQNNIQSIFSRGRLLYGSTPLEDLVNMGTIVRCLTEWTATNVQGIMDQTAICEGIGGYITDLDSTGAVFGNVNTRQKYIQSVSDTLIIPGGATPVARTPADFFQGGKVGPAGNSNASASVTQDNQAGSFSTQRYQINLPFGMFTQRKFIPTKFMASALAVELTLASASECLFVTSTEDLLGLRPTAMVGDPTYFVGNVNLIPEVVSFDASYGNFFI